MDSRPRPPIDPELLAKPEPWLTLSSRPGSSMLRVWLKIQEPLLPQPPGLAQPQSSLCEVTPLLNHLQWLPIAYSLVP